LLLKLLGKGGFSEVYKAFDLVTIKEVACKLHQLNPHWNASRQSNFTRHACREYLIQKSLSHPRVVQLLDVFEIDEHSFCTVLEFCKGGDLDTHLKESTRLKEGEAKLITAQMVDVLTYLNSQQRPIIHYDLKPGNILFDSHGYIKIGDFGLSKIMDNPTDGLELTSQGAGTFWYLPPECFETGEIPRISTKVDVWSTGIIVYQMLYGCKPFGNRLSQQEMITLVKSQRNIVSFPDHPVVSEEAKDFILKCLTPSQRDRPSISTLAQHPFVTFHKSHRTSHK
jgi:tousled-like kinase